MPLKGLYQQHYERVIKPAIERTGLMCVRGDEIFHRANIVGDVWRSLKQARVVVAELSERNPNVLYEVGLAHALGKPVILITRNEDDVPFDLRALRYRFYDVNDPAWGENLVVVLTDMIAAALREPSLSLHLEGIHQEIAYPPLPHAKKVAAPSPIGPDIAGTWSGDFAIDGIETSQIAVLFITQSGNNLSATMSVTVESAEGTEIVHEVMVGQINDRSVALTGSSYTYVKQREGSGYELDSFELILSQSGDVLEGRATSDGEPGKARFKRIA